MIPTILERHRTSIRNAMQDVVQGDTGLRRMLRYHVGLEDENGRAVDGAGKLLRPSLVLFVAEALGGRAGDALAAAVALELVHNFSLVHDDIQDQDRTRRGRPTLWVLHGVAEAINAGDLMYALAFSTVLRAGDHAAAALAAATAEMIEGQSLDLAFERRAIAVDEYLEMIDLKTGALLRCAFELGGLAAGADRAVLAALSALGGAIGRAFQVQDDLLGVWSDGDVLGKPQGSDIRRRKKSFPVAAAFSCAGATDRARLEAIYSSEPVSEADVRWVVDAMERLGVRDAGRERVARHLADAKARLEELPLSASGKDEMRTLIRFLAGRER